MPELNHNKSTFAKGYRNAVAVSPHNTNELSTYSDALYIGNSGGGTALRVRMIDESGSTNVNFVIDASATGIILPISVKLVLDTGTDVDDIVALWF